MKRYGHTQEVVPSPALIQQIISGSNTLRRMQEEINRILKIVFSLAKPDKSCLLSHSVCEFNGNYPFGHNDYKITLLFRVKQSGDAYSLDCVVVSPVHKDILLFTFDGRDLQLKMEFVESVHCALPMILREMLNLSPPLAEKIQPLLRAGNL